MLVLAAMMAASACITVNIYFPAPEVRAAAEEIVEETWGGSERMGPAGEPRTRWCPGWLGVATAHAADKPNVEVETAAIRALKAAMKQRSAKLKPYLAAGNLGIANDGMLVERDVDGVPLKQQAEVRRMVAAENRDRKSLYGEIAEANNYGKERIADIEGIFAEIWVEKADSGWWVQGGDGAWRKR